MSDHLHITTFDELDDDSIEVVGDGWAQCAVCGAYYTAPYGDRLAIDTEGQRWDVCPGGCAEEAGVAEQRLNDPPE